MRCLFLLLIVILSGFLIRRLIILFFMICGRRGILSSICCRMLVVSPCLRFVRSVICGFEGMIILMVCIVIWR